MDSFTYSKVGGTVFFRPRGSYNWSVARAQFDFSLSGLAEEGPRLNERPVQALRQPIDLRPERVLHRAAHPAANHRPQGEHDRVKRLPRL